MLREMVCRLNSAVADEEDGTRDVERLARDMRYHNSPHYLWMGLRGWMLTILM